MVLSPESAERLAAAIAQGVVVPTGQGEPTVVIVTPDALLPDAVPSDGLQRFWIPVVRQSEEAGITVTGGNYRNIISWTVGGEMGRLAEIAFNSDRPSTTNWRLQIGDEEQFTDLVQQAAFSLEFGDNELPPDTEIKIEAETTDGVATIIDAFITGAERRVVA